MGAVKAMTDAARLAEELRAEQDVAAGFERERKLLECQVKDCQTRLDDAEANALNEDKKNATRMQGLVDGLQDKIKSYKKQIEEAEEIAALNLGKFRATQAQVADSAELADLNEKALAKAKAKARGASVAL